VPPPILLQEFAGFSRLLFALLEGSFHRVSLVGAGVKSASPGTASPVPLLAILLHPVSKFY
jgi:hypothetical protein